MKKNHEIRVLLFDVNETMLDITILEPFFQNVFNSSMVFRNWFAELILYSQTMTLSGLYEPFGSLAVATLKMVGANHNIMITKDDVEELKRLLGSLPSHQDVAPALNKLKAAGFRLATLTNSESDSSPTALEKSGLSRFFEREFSIDVVQDFKPHESTYLYAAREMKVEIDEICLVACHFWDIIGAQSAGCSGAFVLRPNNCVLDAKSVPQPNFIARDFSDLVSQFVADP